MRNLYLAQDTHDLVVTDAHNLRFTTTLTEYVSQKIENALSIKNADLDDVNNIFLVVITGIPEVVEVLEFETDYDNSIRKYTVNFKVLAKIYRQLQGPG
jgi:hypothetical protein